MRHMTKGRMKFEIKRIERGLALLQRREREKAREARDLSNRCSAHAMTAGFALAAFKRLVKAGVVAALAISAATAAAGDHAQRKAQREQSHNWIIERQEAYQVQGVPTSRLIIGKREIDIYRDGQMFERGNLVGVKK
jgi:hypothetical protein